MKPAFVSRNRFDVLKTNENEDDTEMHNASENNHDINTEQTNPLPPPIFVRNVGNFNEIRNQLINLAGPDNFYFKSSANNLKINTKNSDSYRAVITYLKTGKYEYHTYQARDNKAFRIVIRNLHPTTSTTEIGVNIENLGYNVRQVSNVLDKSTKRPLPIFFVDLEPAPINNEIFKLSSLLHTKIKIEEPYRRREIIQCTNCQDYGHSKGYCAHPSRCVRCAASHPTAECPKPTNTPATCVLCGGDHPASYRGCSIHKNLQKLYQKPNTNSSSMINKNNIVNHQITATNDETLTPPNISNVKSFPKLPSNSQNHTYFNKTGQNQRTPENVSPDIIPANQLSSFLLEFKQLINPLIQLLTSVINKLILRNVN